MRQNDKENERTDNKSDEECGWTACHVSTPHFEVGYRQARLHRRLDERDESA